MISEQLSREISLKEELAILLSEERNKTAKISQHLNNANRVNAEQKKQISALEKSQKTEKTFKDEYEIKLSRYRDIVRKKDELLTKNQQKLEQFLKNERQNIKVEEELKRLKGSFSKLRNR